MDELLIWLGDEGRNLQRAFCEIIHGQPRRFGSPAKRFGGLSDGNHGVQWSAGFNPADSRRWLAINLEGKKYDNWPIANLILNELHRPLLPSLVSQFGRDINGEVVWNRDYWQATAKPPIVEWNIEPTPIVFRELTEDRWRKALEGALACLDSARDYRGRVTQQEVTLRVAGRSVIGEVSPHLSLQYLGPFNDWESFLAEGKARLKPFHEWACLQSADRRMVRA